MGTVLNLRGTNGSGKSTLARAFLAPYHRNGLAPNLELVHYAAPTRKEPGRQLTVPGYGDVAAKTIVVGPYRTACGGLDGVDNFGRQQAAIGKALRLRADWVIAEGVLASTVYGSWAEFALAVKAMGHAFAFVYLSTPLEVCLQRIRERQVAAGAVREIKTKLVEDKVVAIRRTRERALAAGHLVYDLPEVGARVALVEIMRGNGEVYRARA